MISREEAIERLERMLDETQVVCNSYTATEPIRHALKKDEETYRMAIEAISQPERPKGRWIDAYPEIEKNPMFMYGICSECGCKQSISNKLNFCFDCGADMRGEE